MSAVVLASVLFAPSAVAEELAGCQFNDVVDFNGDGFEDVAVADDQADVDGMVAAGRVHVLFGGSVGTVTLSLADPFVPGDPIGGGRFGTVLDTFDVNLDGCDDLVVGAPYESVDGANEAGAVYILPGSPAGFGTQPTTRYTQQGFTGLVAEQGDQFGFSIDAAHRFDGLPYLAVGAPGEAIGPLSNAGGVLLLAAGASTWLHQDIIGIAGEAEAGDRFGHAVVAGERHVAIGVPGEDIDGFADAGSAHLFGHDAGPSAVLEIAVLNQRDDDQSGAIEEDDRYGWSLSMESFDDVSIGRSTILAVGAPGEAIGEHQEAGRVVSAVVVTATGAVLEQASIHQAVDGVFGASEPGDEFGWTVEIVNRSPEEVPEWSDLMLAVGIPGEEGEPLTDTGAVQLFSLIGAPGDHDVWVDATVLGPEWTATSAARMGEHIAASSTHLYVGDPDGTGAVYLVSWTNLLLNGTDPVRVIRPGHDGVPSAGAVSFGTAMV